MRTRIILTRADVEEVRTDLRAPQRFCELFLFFVCHARPLAGPPGGQLIIPSGAAGHQRHVARRARDPSASKWVGIASGSRRRSIRTITRGREGVIVRAYSLVLGVLSAAFAARVLGQLLVAGLGVEFLPPMDAWYSSLIPYPVLLILQIGIIGIQVGVSRKLWVGAGALAAPRPRLGRALAWVSLIYVLAMVTRYLMTRVMLPETGRFGDMIPIVFHWVLAAYLWILSRHFRGLPLFSRSAWGASCPS